MFSQYDVHQIAAKPPIRLCVILSGGPHLFLDTITIIPLIAHSEVEFTLPIYVRLDVNGDELTLRPDLIASVPVSVLGPKVCSLEQKRIGIQNAVDRLFSGY